MVVDPDFEWLMIDASHIKVHPHAAGAKGGSQERGRSKGGLIQKYIWPWTAMGCRSESMITNGTTIDCTQAHSLIEGLDADNLWADRGL